MLKLFNIIKLSVQLILNNIEILFLGTSSLDFYYYFKINFKTFLVFFKYLKIDKELNDMLIIEGIVDLNVDILG